MGLFIDRSFAAAKRVHINFQVIILGSLLTMPSEAQPFSFLDIWKGQHSTLLFIDCYYGWAIQNSEFFVSLQIRDHIPWLEAFWNVPQNDSDVLLVFLDRPVVIG